MSNWIFVRVGAIFLTICLAIPEHVIGAVPAAKADISDCLIDLAAVRSPPRFAEFSATTQRSERWKGPLFASAPAAEFRTMLQRASSEPPNFAGHYTVATWGCGSSCTDFAIIDRRSGQVFFDKHWRGISGVHVGSEPEGASPAFNLLRFRRDSRLLVVLGAPNEDESREGVTFLEWTGKAFVRLRFVSRNEACTPAP